jgi:hypothetical protein
MVINGMKLVDHVHCGQALWPPSAWMSRSTVLCCCQVGQEGGLPVRPQAGPHHCRIKNQLLCSRITEENWHQVLTLQVSLLACCHHHLYYVGIGVVLVLCDSKHLVMRADAAFLGLCIIN